MNRRDEDFDIVLSDFEDFKAETKSEEAAATLTLALVMERTNTVLMDIRDGKKDLG